MDIIDSQPQKRSWFEDEAFWLAEYDVVFNKNKVRFSFLEIANLIKLSAIKKGDAVLDLCCGIGRHTLQLAKLGYTVTGVDITQAYLRIAREKSLTAGLNVEFIHEDARSFSRPGEYDLIINLFNSFGYFENPVDDKKVLENCIHSLRPGGKLLMELLSKEVVARSFREQYQFEQDGFTVFVRQKVVDDWTWLNCCWRIVKDEMNKEIFFSHRLYSALELKELLFTCGFKNVTAFGSLKGEPFDHNAQNLVLLAEK